MLKTSPSKAGVEGSIPGWGAKILHTSWLKKKKNPQNRSDVVTNSIKTLKNGPHFKNIYLKKWSRTRVKGLHPELVGLRTVQSLGVTKAPSPSWRVSHTPVHHS